MEGVFISHLLSQCVWVVFCGMMIVFRGSIYLCHSAMHMQAAQPWQCHRQSLKAFPGDPDSQWNSSEVRILCSLLIHLSWFLPQGFARQLGCAGVCRVKGWMMSHQPQSQSTDKNKNDIWGWWGRRVGNRQGGEMHWINLSLGALPTVYGDGKEVIGKKAAEINLTVKPRGVWVHGSWEDGLK